MRNVELFKQKIQSIFFVYISWMILLFVNSIWVYFTGNLRQAFGDEAFTRFIYINIGVGIGIFIFGLVLAWFAQKGKLWACWIFVIYCSWRVVDAIWGAIKFNTTGEDIDGWIRVSIFVIGWLYLLTITGRKIKKRATNIKPL